MTVRTPVVAVEGVRSAHGFVLTAVKCALTVAMSVETACTAPIVK